LILGCGFDCGAVRRTILVFHCSLLVALVAKLFESLGVEANERVVLYAVTDLDWVAANFTVFDIVLTANR
jgi:long-subunit acyl-CoA synthetase (AMP-forming)